MKICLKTMLFLTLSCTFISNVVAQQQTLLSNEMAVKLSTLPLHCIEQEYPNKTGHIIHNEIEARLTPQALHPAFYGCFDWHSTVHGHWMLIRLLKTIPDLTNREQIIQSLTHSLTEQNLQAEANYFRQYDSTFERTYGWAWLLKLDEELVTWDNSSAHSWHQNLQPLTYEIVKLWKSYLPKQTYPNRTGVHPNSAFAIGFALDWARTTGDKDFEKQLTEKAKQFYLKDEKTPAYLEPDGSDFFSPSLEIADLMRRILSKKDFARWLDKFYDRKSIDNICQIPIVSDLNDYQTVHLLGLSFSKSWCMKNIASVLPDKHPLKKRFTEASNLLLKNALPLVFEGNYGGEHWLATFAVMALENRE